MRKGPRPISVQIGMAASYWPHNFAAPEANSAELPQEIKDMLLGMRQYQTHSYERKDMPLDIIWRSGEVNIGAIPEHDYKLGNEAILLIPSLINKSYIFDLTKERSMLRWLGEQGVNPYLLSWGESVKDAGQSSIDGIVLDRLIPALEFMRSHAERDIHALGYCMGGTLLSAAATQVSAGLKSVILLAAPWQFHGGSQALLNRVKFWAPSAFPAIDAKGILGVDWMQTVFASLDPAVAIRKFSSFVEMDQESERARLFVAVEDWLNDGVDLPGLVAQQCISDWFIKNTPGAGAWTLRGQIVDPRMINCPVLVIASDRDRLVEYETAAAIAEGINGAVIHNPSCGHIGMIAGRNSVKDVWTPIAQWLKK